MKIVHTLPMLKKGGGERVAVDLANHAVQQGHEVAILVAHSMDPKLLQDRLHRDIKILYVSNRTGSMLSKYFCLFSWLLKNRSWLFEQDILHCHLTFGAVVGTLTKIFRDISGRNLPKVFETYHAVGMTIPTIHRWVHTRLAEHRDALVLMAEDHYWNAFLSARPNLLSKVIHNGIPLSNEIQVAITEQKAYRRDIGVPDSCEFVVGTVGRLDPDRQPWLYLPVFAEVARVLGKKVHFVIAGDGTEYNRIKSLSKDSGLEGKISFPGMVLNQILPCSIMNLYITLNVGSVTGLAALEAASTALPVIAIQLYEDYTEKEDHWIWSSTDPMEIAQRIIDLYNSPADRQALGKRQEKYVHTHYTVDVMAGSYYDLYKRALDNTHTK